MPASKHLYDPSRDTLLTTLFMHRDEEGNFYDIDTHLYHSAKHGFYLQEKRAQVWIERCWENVSELMHHFVSTDAPRRILSCPCRPLTPAQVIRLIIHEHVPEEEGARELALRALANAGVEDSPAGQPSS